MRANIYIRKANKDKWNAIPDKSNWINVLLEASGDTSRYGAIQMSPVGPRVEVLTEGMDAEPVGPMLTPPPVAKKPKESLRVTSIDQLVDEIEAQIKPPRKRHKAIEEAAGASFSPGAFKEDEFKFCKHDQVKGFCKYGCK